MPSASPVSGASSTEPLTSTISAWRPVRSKWRAAIRGYFVATRITPSRRSASSSRSSPGGRRDDHHARAEPQVEQLVDRPLGLLGEHVLAGDPEVGGAGLDVGRHVGRPHRDDPRVLEQQLAVVRAHLGRVDAEPRRAGRACRASARRGAPRSAGRRGSQQLLPGARPRARCAAARRRARSPRRAGRGRSGRAGRRSGRRRRAARPAPGRRPRTPRPCSSRAPRARPRSKITRSAHARLGQHRRSTVAQAVRRRRRRASSTSGPAAQLRDARRAPRSPRRRAAGPRPRAPARRSRA